MIFAIFMNSTLSISPTVYTVSSIFYYIGLGFFLTSAIGTIAKISKESGMNARCDKYCTFLRLGFLGVFSWAAGAVVAQLDFGSAPKVSAILFRAATITWLVAYLLSVPVTAYLAYMDVRKRKLDYGQSWANWALIASMPFFVVRFSYQMYGVPTSTFAQFLARFYLMESIVVVLNLTAARFASKRWHKELELEMRTRDAIVDIARKAINELPHNIGSSGPGKFWLPAVLPDGVVAILKSQDILNRKGAMCRQLSIVARAIPMYLVNDAVHIDAKDSLEPLRVASMDRYPDHLEDPYECLVVSFALDIAIIHWKVLNGDMYLEDVENGSEPGDGAEMEELVPSANRTSALDFQSDPSLLDIIRIANGDENAGTPEEREAYGASRAIACAYSLYETMKELRTLSQDAPPPYADNQDDLYVPWVEHEVEEVKESEKMDRKETVEEIERMCLLQSPLWDQKPLDILWTVMRKFLWQALVSTARVEHFIEFAQRNHAVRMLRLTPAESARRLQACGEALKFASLLIDLRMWDEATSAFREIPARARAAMELWFLKHNDGDPIQTRTDMQNCKRLIVCLDGKWKARACYEYFLEKEFGKSERTRKIVEASIPERVRQGLAGT